MQTINSRNNFTKGATFHIFDKDLQTDQITYKERKKKKNKESYQTSRLTFLLDQLSTFLSSTNPHTRPKSNHFTANLIALSSSRGPPFPENSPKLVNTNILKVEQARYVNIYLSISHLLHQDYIIMYASTRCRWKKLKSACLDGFSNIEPGVTRRESRGGLITRVNVLGPGNFFLLSSIFESLNARVTIGHDKPARPPRGMINDEPRRYFSTNLSGLEFLGRRTTSG